MRKALFFVSFLSLFLFFTTEVSASLLTINKSGQVIWSVLSEESSGPASPQSYLTVKEVANNPPLPNASISLTKESEKISLVVSSENEKKEFDVSGWKDDLIEIEERPAMQRIKIGIEGESFSLEQKGITALTAFPIAIDAKRATLSVLTPSGNQYLTVLPFGAAESMIRAGIISRVAEGKKLILNEQGKGLAYRVSGEKVIDIFNVFSFSIPVTAQVSATNGQLLLIEEPKWFRILNFLFV